MKFYGLKNCDSCKKAQKALNTVGIKFEVIDVRADGVDPQMLKRWVEQAGFEKLLNTKSTTWRNLDEVDKENVDAKRAIKLMAAHPTLIKRPVIEQGDQIFIGWTRDVMSQFGL